MSARRLALTRLCAEVANGEARPDALAKVIAREWSVELLDGLLYRFISDRDVAGLLSARLETLGVSEPAILAHMAMSCFLFADDAKARRLAEEAAARQPDLVEALDVLMMLETDRVAKRALCERILAIEPENDKARTYRDLLDAGAPLHRGNFVVDLTKRR